jgi:hypothetical protein
MKKLLNIWILFFFSACFAQENISELKADDGVFWKIQNKANKKISYIFGTIHLIDKDKYVLPKTVYKRLEKSELVILELDDLENQSKVFDLLILKEGRMTDILNSSQRDSLYAYTKMKLGMDSLLFEKSMGKFKPIFFLQLPYASLILKCESYDKNLYQLAKEAQIPILGLETVEEQIGFFDNLSNKTKVQMIMQVISDTNNFKKAWDQMQDLYSNQKISDLVSINTGTADITTFFEKTLSSDRNLKWVQILTQKMNEKSIFVAVGAAHLPGKDGLLNLLKQQDFEVTRVEIKLK